MDVHDSREAADWPTACDQTAAGRAGYLLENSDVEGGFTRIQLEYRTLVLFTWYLLPRINGLLAGLSAAWVLSGVHDVKRLQAFVQSLRCRASARAKACQRALLSLPASAVAARGLSHIHEGERLLSGRAHRTAHSVRVGHEQQPHFVCLYET